MYANLATTTRAILEDRGLRLLDEIANGAEPLRDDEPMLPELEATHDFLVLNQRPDLIAQPEPAPIYPLYQP